MVDRWTRIRLGSRVEGMSIGEAVRRVLTPNRTKVLYPPRDESIFARIRNAWHRITHRLLPLGGSSEGNHVKLYFDGNSAFSAMWDGIRNAKKVINCNTYILELDAVGLKTISLLSEAQRRGVQVTLVFDGFGSMPIDTANVHLVDLMSHGAQVIEFNPVMGLPWNWRRFNIALRNHRKLLIVDDEFGFCGGMNLTADYAGVGVGGTGYFRDSLLRVQGPAAQDLNHVFYDALEEADEEHRRKVPLASSKARSQFVEMVRDTYNLLTGKEVKKPLIHDKTAEDVAPTPSTTAPPSAIPATAIEENSLPFRNAEHEGAERIRLGSSTSQVVPALTEKPLHPYGKKKGPPFAPHSNTNYQVTKAMFERHRLVPIKAEDNPVFSIFNADMPLRFQERNMDAMRSAIYKVGKSSFVVRIKTALTRAHSFISKSRSWGKYHGAEVPEEVLTEEDQLFYETLQRERTKRLLAESEEILENYEATAVVEEDGCFIQVLESNVFREKRLLQRALAATIHHSEHRVYITSPYFLPNYLIKNCMAAAAQRGVDVRVLTVAEGKTDVPWVRWGCEHLYSFLLSRGVKIYELEAQRLHAKSVTVDGLYTSIGSANIDSWSLARMLEANVTLLDAKITAQAEAQFLRDLIGAREVKMDSLRKRSPLSKVLHWLSYTFYRL